MHLKFKFKEDGLKALMKLQGWKSYADIARATGFTRQYIAMCVSNGTGLSSDLIGRILFIAGMWDKPHCWGELLELVPKHGRWDPNHPSFNLMKEEGKVPYNSRYSPSANIRKSSYDVETQ